MKKSRTIVIGGGAAGLMAAGRAAERGAEVILLEKMERTGRKIGISGKGRCNLGNSSPLTDFITHFDKNGNFLRGCFQQFFTPDMVAFFERMNLPLVTERGGRIFPVSGRALDVVRALNNWLKAGRVTVKTGAPVTALLVRDGRVSGVVSLGEELPCDSIVLATGGKSYPRTGSTGDGYRLAASLGHTIIPLRPALVPLNSPDPAVRRMNGLDLRNIQVRLFIDGKRRGQDFGELSFTGFGLSGPVVLSLSGIIVDALDSGHKVTLSLDLKPALDHTKLDDRLLRDLAGRGGEPIDSILRGLLPREMIPVCLESCDLPEDVDTAHFPGKYRKRLVQWLKDFRIDIDGYRSFDEAIITAGGVNLKEIDPRTMESKLVGGLFIVGELLDLQADTGGYNLQAAFSTGWVAGSFC
ncbi:MAG: FAD-dependent oxidoreductase [Desulfobulbaceae bacterium BRH_c16a]|nr:MAG: FAD-dependent oxidoreductase [Desulfobulbaceae bacterium BRH_c16a]